MKNLSVICPTYKNPEYLDIFLKSATENKRLNSTEIIVIIDGFASESKHIIDKYKDTVKYLEFENNQGMSTAINYGVYNSSNEYILVVNDDNVCPIEYDFRLLELLSVKPNVIISPNQIEPIGPSIFDFNIKNFGQDSKSFQYNSFLEYENKIRTNTNELLSNGEIFPFVMKKKDYLMVNGFDPLYQSPFVCDWDFFLKLELSGKEFYRTNNTLLYHFGSKATKKRNDTEASDFVLSEQMAIKTFYYKWGFYPKNGISNSKLPSKSDANYLYI